MEKMKKIKLGYIPISKSSFDTEWAKNISEKTYNALKDFKKADVVKSKIILNSFDLVETINYFKEEQIDLLIVHFCTFCFGNIIPGIVTNLNVPIILLSLPDPGFDGNKIRSNSFCALNMNTHLLYKMNKKYRSLFSSLENKTINKDLEKIISAIYVIKNMQSKRIGLVGSRAPGFYTSNFDELKLRNEMGLEVEYIDLSRVYYTAKKIGKNELLNKDNYIKQYVSKISGVTANDYEKLVRIYSALIKISEDYKIDSYAIKCWPEFMEDYGIAICPVLGMLNTYGIPTACEGDIYGVVTMIIQKYISGKTPFFSDFIYIDNDNTGLFWHCGSAPCNLAKNISDVILRNYPKFQKDTPEGGCTFNFSIDAKNKEVSISRLGTDINGFFRILNINATGEEVGEIIRGNTCKVKFHNPIEIIKNTILNNGFEHHYSVILSNISAELEEISFWKNIKIYQC